MSCAYTFVWGYMPTSCITNGNNEEVVIVNTPDSIQGGGGGVTSVYLIMLMIFMGLCRRINRFVDKVAIFVHKLQSMPVG